MSYDLILHPRQKRLQAADLREWAIASSYYPYTEMPFTITTEDNGARFQYFNQETTGVSFYLRFWSGNHDGQLSFNMNYARPSFFALEAMPILHQWITHFDLRVEDPQADPIPNDHPTVEELIEGWQRSNRSAVQSIEKNYNIKFQTMPAAKSQAWWRYMFNLREVALQFAEAATYPMYVQASVQTGELNTMLAWPQPPGGMVFPIADQVFLTDRLGGIRWETFMKHFEAYLSVLTVDEVDGYILYFEEAEEALPLYQSIPLEFTTADFGRPLASHEFIDTEALLL